jgi:uncharacterized protein YfaQ (DUF2300 family)
VTTLVIETLVTELSQDIRLSGKERYSIGAIIPYIYMHNAPSGTFTLSLINQAVTVFSQSFTSSDIKASIQTVNNYAHVFYPVIPTNPIQLDSGIYTVRITASGYAPTSVSFLALIRQHEDLNNKLDYVPLTDDENPLAIRLKVYKRGEL